jgi:hypothetical protein
VIFVLLCLTAEACRVTCDPVRTSKKTESKRPNVRRAPRGMIGPIKEMSELAQAEKEE